MGKGSSDFHRNKLDLTFQAPKHCAKFHENRMKIVAAGATTDTLTDRQTDASDFMICALQWDR